MTLSASSLGCWDEDEFRAVFVLHYAGIVRLLVRLLGELSDAEEVVNDAFWRTRLQDAAQDDDNLEVACTSPCEKGARCEVLAGTVS
jgi:hypothetical protein